MEVKTYTKKDIASEIASRKGISVRSSVKLVDEFFDSLRV